MNIMTFLSFRFVAVLLAGSVIANAADLSVAGHVSIQETLDANPGRMIFVPADDYRITEKIRLRGERSGLFGPGRIIQENPEHPIIVTGGALGAGRAVLVRGTLAFAPDEPTRPAETVRLTFALKPLGTGYGRGMVTLADAQTGYLAVGLRLGHGGGGNGHVFSGLNVEGKWQSLGVVGFLADRWCRVVITAHGDKEAVVYEIEDLHSQRTRVRTLQRRFVGRGSSRLTISPDHAEAVTVDEIRWETGR